MLFNKKIYICSCNEWVTSKLIFMLFPLTTPSKNEKMKKIFLSAAALLMIASLTVNAQQQEPKKEAKKEEKKEVKKEEHKAEHKAENKGEHKGEQKGEHKGEHKDQPKK